MAPLIGLMAFPIALVLLACRLPIAAVLFGTGLVGQLALRADGQGLLANISASGDAVMAGLQELARPEILLIPLVLALGNLAFYGGLSTRIYESANLRLRRVPGGAAFAAILGCGGFSALCGSSTACATTMGRICVPEMLKQGCDARLAASAVGIGGTLGALIPPSLLFVVYGLFSRTGTADLFLAGLLPGLLSLLGMVLAILWWMTAEPGVVPKPAAQARSAGAHAPLWPALLPMVLILAGLMTGAASPLVLLLAACCMTIVIALLDHRLEPEALSVTGLETLRQSLRILVLVLAARVFFDFVTASGAAGLLTEWADAAGLPPLAAVFLIVLVYLGLGMFLEPATVLGLTLAFVLPVIDHYDLNPIWFGVVLVKVLEIGLVTPPVGLNVFIVASVTRQTNLAEIFFGIARFLMVDVLVLMILILFPVTATLLPTIF